jgi:hypothetical protein
MEVSDTAQYFQSEVRHSMNGSRTQFTSQAIAYLTFLREGLGVLPGTGGSRAIAADLHQPESAIRRLPAEGTSSRRPRRNGSCERGSAMRDKDLMCPDLLGEIVLVGVGMILVSLLLFIVAAFAQLREQRISSEELCRQQFKRVQFSSTTPF